RLPRGPASRSRCAARARTAARPRGSGRAWCAWPRPAPTACAAAGPPGRSTAGLGLGGEDAERHREGLVLLRLRVVLCLDRRHDAVPGQVLAVRQEEAAHREIEGTAVRQALHLLEDP